MKYMMEYMHIPRLKLTRNSMLISLFWNKTHGIMALCLGKAALILPPGAILDSYQNQHTVSTAPTTRGAMTCGDAHLYVPPSPFPAHVSARISKPSPNRNMAWPT